MTLFIVEDDEIQTLILELMAKKLGLEFKGAESYGRKAVKKICEQRPDIVLLDVMLKDSFDGIDVAREIQKVYEPVIIYVTGNSDERHISRAEKHGFYDYITKPVSLHRLQSSIESLHRD